MSRGLKVLILAFFLIIPTSVFAIGSYSDDVVILEKDQIINQNYYAAGNVVEIYGTVNGDIFVAGSTIVIDSENINGDIFAAGSNISISGKVDGSLRLLGENINLTGEVSRNIMSAGQNFRLDPETNLAGQLTFWGQMLNVGGQVDRIEGACSTFRLDGQVKNDVDIYLLDNLDDAINLSDQAVIGGTLYYKSFNKLSINPQASVSDTAFKQILKKEKPKFDKFGLAGMLFRFFSMLALGMLALYLWPSVFFGAYKSVCKKPLVRFFQGFALLILTPIFCILLAITLIGLPLAIVIMVLWALMLYLLGILAAWILGSFIKDKLLAKYKWPNLSILAFGIFLWILISKLPYLGTLVTMLIYFMAWGSIYKLFKKSKQTK